MFFFRKNLKTNPPLNLQQYLTPFDRIFATESNAILGRIFPSWTEKFHKKGLSKARHHRHMQTHMQAAAVTFYDNIWCDYCKLCPQQQQQQEPAQGLVALDGVWTGENHRNKCFPPFFLGWKIESTCGFWKFLCSLKFAVAFNKNANSYFFMKPVWHGVILSLSLLLGFEITHVFMVCAYDRSHFPRGLGRPGLVTWRGIKSYAPIKFYSFARFGGFPEEDNLKQVVCGCAKI